MNKQYLMKTFAAFAFIFSALTIIEGSLVLFKISIPGYKIFAPLLIYNIAMGVVGLFVSVQIWKRRQQAVKYSSIVAAVHATISIITAIIYFTHEIVAIDSVKAMVIRSLLWCAVSFVAFKNKK